MAEFARGNLSESRRMCELALAREPRDARALHLAAAIALTEGRADEALRHADAAIASDPRDATQYQTRGQVLRAQGRQSEAERDFRKAIELAPGFADAHASLGASMLNRGAAAEARAFLERAVASRPAEAAWRYNLALCDLSEDRLPEAEANLRAALQSRPQWADALNLLGSVLVRSGRASEARTAIESALRVAPAMSSAWNNLGLALSSVGDLAGARQALGRCVELAPEDPSGWTHLANVDRALGDREGAERGYRQALAIDPYHAVACQNLGNLLREAGRLEEAVASLENAVRHSGSAEAHMSLAVALLAAQRPQRAWDEYGWRAGREPVPAKAILDSARRAPGVLAIESEQGLGDSLFFLRWAALPEWRSGMALRWEGDPRLAPFLESALATKPTQTPASIRVLAGDLPRLAGASAPTYPRALPLAVPGALRDAARRELEAFGPAPYLAVAWRAGSAPRPGEEVLTKEVPLELLARALAPWRGSLVCVQRHPAPGELDALRRHSGRPVFDAASLNDDLPRMAGLLAAVDLYAGVSSTNVHIAAGVGTAARILVPDPPDWRYAGPGDKTPWFPDYPLHRQDPAGSWEKALGELSGALEAFAP